MGTFLISWQTGTRLDSRRTNLRHGGRNPLGLESMQMIRRIGLGMALAVCAAVEAAEPGVAVEKPTAPVAAPAAPTTTAKPAAPATPKAPPGKPLDLRIGDVRRYMMPNEYLEAIRAPNADENTVVVEARRELLPVEYEEPIPTWPLGPLWWGLKNPAQSWRILLPDINRPAEGPRTPEDKVPPPVFRWGP